MSGNVKITDGIPGDTVSDLSFCDRTPHLLSAASWDNTLRVWEIQPNGTSSRSVLCVREADKDAVLRCAFSRSADLYYGMARGDVKVVRSGSTSGAAVGHHIGVVTGLRFCEGRSAVVTASTDYTLCLWDPKTPGKAVQTVKLPEKAVALDATGDSVVVAMLDQIAMIDVKNPTLQKKASKLTTPITSIGALPRTSAGYGYIAGTVDGTVELFNGTTYSTAQCHRREQTKEAFSSNCISVSHERQGALSGGGDGRIQFFNLSSSLVKTQEATISQTSTRPITASSFAYSGGIYAVALGYDWAKGADEYPSKGPQEPEIILRKVSSQQIP